MNYNIYEAIQTIITNAIENNVTEEAGSFELLGVEQAVEDILEALEENFIIKDK